MTLEMLLGAKPAEEAMPDTLLFIMPKPAEYEPVIEDP